MQFLLTDTDWPGAIDLLTSFLTPRDFIFESEIESLKARNPRMRVATAKTNPAGLSPSPPPFIGARPVWAVEQADVLRVLAPIWTEKPETPVASHRVL